MRPRIIILSAFLSPFRSGAEACVEEVSKRLASEFDITIITARLRRDLAKTDMMNGVKVIRVGVGSGIDKWLYPFLAPLKARSLRPDIIHAVLESYAGLALILTKWLGLKAKRILTCQSTNTSMFLGLMHRSADNVTCISSVLMQRAKKFGRNDAVLIPNGIDLNALQDAVSNTQKVPGRILFVGRLERVKGVDTLLHALAKIPRTTDGPILHIVGDGSLRQFLKQWVSTLGQVDRVKFLGYVSGPALMKEYAEAEIFCGLSRSEALGNVFLEAQAAGCAVVTTVAGGIPDIVHTDAGILIQPEDSAAAADALLQLLKDHTLQRKMGEAGKRNAAQYDWAPIAEKYAAIYR